MKPINLLFALCAVILVGCESNSSSRLAVMSERDTNGFIPLGEALQLAQKEVPDGFAIEASLEIEDDDEAAAYEVGFYVAANQQLVEVAVDAVTGAILEVEVEDGDNDDEDDGDNDDDDDD